MNESAYKVLVGFTKLTESEKAIFIAEINKYQRSSEYAKIELSRTFSSKSVGPKNTICTCCGR